MIKRQVVKGKVRINGRFYGPQDGCEPPKEGTYLRFMLTKNATEVFQLDETGLEKVSFWCLCEGEQR